jgi:hypothetical protein
MSAIYQFYQKVHGRTQVIIHRFNEKWVIMSATGRLKFSDREHSYHWAQNQTFWPRKDELAELNIPCNATNGAKLDSCQIHERAKLAERLQISSNSACMESSHKLAATKKVVCGLVISRLFVNFSSKIYIIMSSRCRFESNLSLQLQKDEQYAPNSL